MHDVVIIKTSDHMHDSGHVSDVAEEFVPQSFTLRRALYKACDIAELDRRIDSPLGVVYLVQLRYSLIRNSYDAYIRLDRTERIVRDFRPRLRDRIKKCAFAYVRQSHDSQFHFLPPM